VAARGSFSLSVGGSRPNSTDWLLDGVDNNELTGGGIGIFSSIDDIQEFKVLTYTYSAEYGSRAGPTVLVSTKSGTNDIHGSLLSLCAIPISMPRATLPRRGKFNLNQFGGSVGGPIIKNKTFFFVDAEQKYQRHGIPFTVWCRRWPCARATFPPTPSAILFPESALLSLRKSPIRT